MTGQQAAPPQRDIKEVCRRGLEIYERDLKHKLEPEHNHKRITINILNGDYAIDDDPIRAWEIMKEKYPDGIFFGHRVGHRAAVHFRSPRLVA